MTPEEVVIQLEASRGQRYMVFNLVWSVPGTAGAIMIRRKSSAKIGFDLTMLGEAWKKDLDVDHSRQEHRS